MKKLRYWSPYKLKDIETISITILSIGFDKVNIGPNIMQKEKDKTLWKCVIPFDYSAKNKTVTYKCEAIIKGIPPI